MNNNPTSEKLTFQDLISKHNIEIPIIQRDYAQGRESKVDIRDNFLNDLSEIIHDRKLELDFVYGSVKEDNDGMTTLKPLDGQQRLTTLFLLHWFVAVKECKLQDELKKLLTKFTYETRTSSREFCIDLINKGIFYNEKQIISEQIIDTYWFFLSWKRDPTIKSMLRMLDAIQEKFGDKPEVWEKLNNISFHYIELQNFGLSDDLYIKINARGKPLTDFENFKARFEQHIQKNNWENNENPAGKFSYLIDTLWTDLFWNYRDETEHIFDEQLLNFFRTMAVINYALKKNTIGRDEIFANNIRILRSRDEKARLVEIPISFNQYVKLDCFDENYFKTLKATLNKLSDKNGLKKFLSSSTYVDEERIFNGAIRNDLSYPDLVVAFAYYQYLASEEDIEEEKLKRWMRIVRNLVEGSRPYLFNNANEFANALRSINELLQHRNSIVKYFTETQINSLSGFISEQVLEEKLKAELISQNEDWKNAIIEIENHKYFNGQIGFLLHWCEINSKPNLTCFKQYVEKSKLIFGDNGLNHFDNFILERALLATGDYLLGKGKNYSFLIDHERDISWKRLLRDNDEKRDILRQLVDNVSVLNFMDDLQIIIEQFSDQDDWRYNFIKQFEMISACGSQKLIRWNSEFDILLLGSTTTSGYHNEYYSYSLFIELKSQFMLRDISYYAQRSVQDWKYFEFDDDQIAFDQYYRKYFRTKASNWADKQEFESRGAVFNYIGANIQSKFDEQILS